jgi:hypothetical protein
MDGEAIWGKQDLMGLFRSPKVSDEIPDINRREAMR